jgi:hypothetical protein
MIRAGRVFIILSIRIISLMCPDLCFLAFWSSLKLSRFDVVWNQCRKSGGGLGQSTEKSARVRGCLQRIRSWADYQSQYSRIREYLPCMQWRAINRNPVGQWTISKWVSALSLEKVLDYPCLCLYIYILYVHVHMRAYLDIKLHKHT